MPAFDRESKPRHRARPTRRVIRGLLASIAAVLSATIFGLLASGGTYAMWVTSASPTTPSISTGSATLTASQSFTVSSWSNLLPGETVRQPFTLTNTGTVKLSLAASATSGSGDYEVRVASGTCPGTALTGSSIVGSPASIGTLNASASTTACLEIKLKSTAAPATTSTIAVTVTGTQVP